MATETLASPQTEQNPLVAPSCPDPVEHYEVVDGQITEEPPLGAREVNIATTLTLLLGQYVLSKQLGRMAAEGLSSSSMSLVSGGDPMWRSSRRSAGR